VSANAAPQAAPTMASDLSHAERTERINAIKPSRARHIHAGRRTAHVVRRGLVRACVDTMNRASKPIGVKSQVRVRVSQEFEL